MTGRVSALFTGLTDPGRERTWGQVIVFYVLGTVTVFVLHNIVYSVLLNVFPPERRGGTGGVDRLGPGGGAEVVVPDQLAQLGGLGTAVILVTALAGLILTKKRLWRDGVSLALGGAAVAGGLLLGAIGGMIPVALLTRRPVAG